MIPRYQKILFFVLLFASLAMGFMLWQLRDRAQKRLAANDDATPTEAPTVIPSEQATLMVADDETNALTLQPRSLPLPSDAGARARAILGKLLEFYASADSAHPVPGGAAGVTQVFLMPVPAAVAPNNTLAPASSKTSSATGKTPSTAGQNSSGPLLAVVNLTGVFAASHPSGIETESLTVLSICDTLHANLPRVAQVRFLIDGAQRATLAGHADLTRTYLTTETPAAETSSK